MKVHVYCTRLWETDLLDKLFLLKINNKSFLHFHVRQESNGGGVDANDVGKRRTDKVYQVIGQHRNEHML